MRDYCTFNNIYMVLEMLEEGKNGIVLRIYMIADKRKLENYGGISLLNRSYTLYSKI